MTDTEILWSLIASLTLCDHMGDVSDAVSKALELMKAPKEVLDVDWDDLGKELHKQRVKTLYGTEMGED